MATDGPGRRYRLIRWALTPLIGLLAGVLIVTAVAQSSRSVPPVSKELMTAIEKLRPLHRKLGKPQPGDWLAHHKEPGQTFEQYRASRPLIPTADRRTIYIQPIGRFSDKQREVVKLTAQFIERYYGLPVKTLEDLPDSIVPAKARRTHPSWGDRQVLTGYVLNEVLTPRLPRDAFALIAFTSSDLWPGEGWNFVFGQASLTERVGVWSIYRFGDPAGGEEGFRLCLRRTMATAVHELGHMFSMLHCTAYECVMCGSNSLPESDRRPIELCPECLAKACWATGAEPAARFAGLLEFCKAHGLDGPAEFYARSLATLRGEPPASQPASAPDTDELTK